MMPDREIVWSYGGGTQSVAIAVLIAKGMLPVPASALIARMDREMPRTFAYLAEHVAPMLARVGLTINIVAPDHYTHGLYYNDGDPLPLVPSFTTNGRTPALCSGNWKRDRIYRALRELGFGPSRPVVQWIGYSVDEMDRAGRAKPRRQWALPDFPLITRIPLRRENCIKLIADAGLPVAPRSRCFDCANQTNEEWREVRDTEPALFQLAIARDQEIRDKDPHHALYLHRARVPLGQVDLADAPEDPSLWADGCNSAGCYT